MQRVGLHRWSSLQLQLVRLPYLPQTANIFDKYFRYANFAEFAPRSLYGLRKRSCSFTDSTGLFAEAMHRANKEELLKDPSCKSRNDSVCPEARTCGSGTCVVLGRCICKRSEKLVFLGSPQVLPPAVPTGNTDISPSTEMQGTCHTVLRATPS